MNNEYSIVQASPPSWSPVVVATEKLPNAGPVVDSKGDVFFGDQGYVGVNAEIRRRLCG